MQADQAIRLVLQSARERAANVWRAPLALVRKARPLAWLNWLVQRFRELLKG